MTMYPSREFSEIQLTQGKYDSAEVTQILNDWYDLEFGYLDRSPVLAEEFTKTITAIAQMVYVFNPTEKFNSPEEYDLCMGRLRISYHTPGRVGIITRGVVMETFFPDGENRLGSDLLSKISK